MHFQLAARRSSAILLIFCSYKYEKRILSYKKYCRDFISCTHESCDAKQKLAHWDV